MKWLLEKLRALCKPAEPPPPTQCFCPGCKQDLVSQKYVRYFYTDDDEFVNYMCSCGVMSTWDFDFPAPLLLWSVDTAGRRVNHHG